MAITRETGRVPPAAALRAEIAKRRTSATVQLSGLGPVLEMLDAYIAQQDAERDEVRAALGLLASLATPTTDLQRHAITKLRTWARTGLT